MLRDFLSPWVLPETLYLLIYYARLYSKLRLIFLFCATLPVFSKIMQTSSLYRLLFLFLSNVMIGYALALLSDTNPSTARKFLEEGGEI